MIQYRFAFDPQDRIVDIQNLPTSTGQGPFRCIGCGEPLAAKTRGEKKARHFAHRTDLLCGQETYLHKLAKQTFLEVYQKCLDANQPFVVELQHPVVCSRYSHALGEACYTGSSALEHVLTGYYDGIRLETRDESFVPDLLIYHRAQPEKRIYVEVAVTHSLSEAKRDSGQRIIEIPVRCESDVDRIRSRRLAEPEVRFLNLPRKPLGAEECPCSNRRFYALYVYQSGKSFATLDEMSVLEKHRQGYGSSIVYERLVDAGRYVPSAYDLFREMAEDAAQSDHPFKTCFLCRHGEQSQTPGRETAAYCRRFRKLSNSRDAAACPDYEITFRSIQDEKDAGCAADPASCRSEARRRLPIGPYDGGPGCGTLTQQPVGSGNEARDGASQAAAQPDLRAVQERWDSILEFLAARSRRLKRLMDGARPVAAAAGVLTIEFAEWYQQLQATEPRVLHQVEAVLTEVFGAPVRLEAVLREELESKGE